MVDFFGMTLVDPTNPTDTSGAVFRLSRTPDEDSHVALAVAT